jgi:hypothetical protein
MKSKPSNNRGAARTAAGGNTLVVVMIVITTLSACVMASLNYTSTVSRNVQRTNTYRKAVEVGDGAIDFLFTHWREKCRPQPNVHFKGQDFSAIPMPPPTMFPDVKNFQAVSAADPTKPVSNLKVTALDTTWKPIGDGAAVPGAYGMNIGTVSYFYLASADVTLPNTFGAPTRVNLRRVMEKQIMSPWNYAIFYVDRLEIHPGPLFNVTGWVHTNERLYNAHNTLTYESKVTYGEDWYIAFAPGDGAHSAAPQKPNHAANLPPALDQAHQPFGLDSSRIFNSTDPNPNNDSYRELVERPSTGFADPIAEARYYNQADVKLLVSDNGSGSPVLTIKNSADVTVTAASPAGSTDRALFEVFNSAVTLGEKIQDNREAAEVRLVSVDMSKVNAALRPVGGTNTGPLAGKLYNTGFKGVIYASDTSYTATRRRGIRLRNGGIMPPGGITVASDNPVYIQGDYNTGTMGATQPNSNQSGGDPTKNTVTGYQKQSCAVLGDAVMILSNSWSDANSYKTVGERIASPTTVNTAIVSGIVPTGTVGNNYSGGAENFPRFMEKWGSGTTFTYYGSMVQLFSSKQNTGIWGKGNVYDPPRRKWYFDRQFYTDPPPGTLSLVSYKKGRWYMD